MTNKIRYSDNFHDIKIPNFIMPFVSVYPIFSTLYAESFSGKEVRKSDTYQNKLKFLIDHCRLSEEEFINFQNFFINRNGKRFSFRIRNPINYKASSEKLLQIENGKFQLCKKSFYSEQIVNITKPLPSTIKLYSDHESKIDFNIDPLTGILTIKDTNVNFASIKANFEFDTEVRFNTDILNHKILRDGSIELSNVELIEII